MDHYEIRVHIEGLAEPSKLEKIAQHIRSLARLRGQQEAERLRKAFRLIKGGR